MNTTSTTHHDRLVQEKTSWIKIGIIFLLGTLYFSSVQAQVKIGTNPNTIEKSALLELESQTEGLLLPRLTDTLAINTLNPPSGMLIYLNKAPKAGVYIRTNGGWNFLSGGGSNMTTPSATTSITGTIQLAGDLAGSAAAPTVPGLALKANTASPAFTGTVTGITGAMVGLGKVSNTADADKAISTATQTALANKVTAVSGMGLSAESYTTAEKTKLTAILGANTGDQDLSSYATNTSLGLKENVSNKSTLATLGTSDALYPSQNAVKSYVDTQVAAATIADADASTRGKIQLAGDLSGTAAAPTVPGLTLKANTASPAFTGTVTGIDKAMVGLPNVNNTADADKPVSTAVQTAIDGKVNTVTGMGLSAESYTTAEKTKLTAITGANTGDQDLSSYATNVNLNLKENLSNKSIDVIADALSDDKYTSVKSIKSYVDGRAASASNAVSISANTTLNLANSIVYCSGAFTLTLPAATAAPGKIYVFSKTDEANTVLIFSEAIYITANTSFTQLNYPKSFRIQSENGKWMILK